MKANVYVNLKKTVLDPQGQTILAALHGLGFSRVRDVRQGKCFELALASGLTVEQARAEVERIAREVLTNPVIEEYSYELLEDSSGRRTSRGGLLREPPGPPKPLR